MSVLLNAADMLVGAIASVVTKKQSRTVDLN